MQTNTSGDSTDETGDPDRNGEEQTGGAESNAHTVSFPLIVIGASTGGMEALRILVAGLPAGFEASLFIVWHMSPDVRGVLPEILNRANTLYAAHAYDGEPIEKSRIYVAPPDHHLIVEKGRLHISRGPKENRFRPAVDPLFRSAAYQYGPQVIGIILSGALDDGTAGLWAVKSRGGFAIVQNPLDAEVPSMPASALRHVRVDYSLPVSEMPALLINLIKELTTNPVNIAMKKDKKTETEISIAADESPLSTDVMKMGELSPFTCPECHGVLTTIKEGTLKRYRCHTGHAFSVDSLLSALTENIEANLWTAIRSMKESTMLLNHVGDHFAELNDGPLAAKYFQKAREAQHRAEVIRGMVTQHEQLSKEGILQEAESDK